MSKTLRLSRRWSKILGLASTLTLYCSSITYAAPDRDLFGKPAHADEKTVDRTVSGKVTDESNSVLPGVSIILKGTQRGTTTDANGAFKIEVPDNATLIFSFVGYTPQEIIVGNQTAINLKLRPDSKVLEEIVVIGYGTLRKSDLTGSVATVKAEQIMERPAPSLAQALAGRMAGVQVNTNSGRPGGRTTIRVRGFSSINSSNNPLYVVDGVMLPQATSRSLVRPLTTLTPTILYRLKY